MPLVLCRTLQVAARQVEADGVAEDAVERLGDRDVGAAATDCHDQFNLVLQLRGLRRVKHVHRRHAAGHQRVRRLAEEERRLARVGAHLRGMIGIVATDAVDAADGKHSIVAGDRQGGLRCGREDVVHERSLGLGGNWMTVWTPVRRCPATRRREGCSPFKRDYRCLRSRTQDHSGSQGGWPAPAPRNARSRGGRPRRRRRRFRAPDGRCIRRSRR